MSKVKYIILRNLLERYERGYLSEISFLYLVTQCLYSHLTKDLDDEKIRQ